MGFANFRKRKKHHIEIKKNLKDKFPKVHIFQLCSVNSLKNCLILCRIGFLISFSNLARSSDPSRRIFYFFFLILCQYMDLTCN